jgi:hypothetical protein
VISYGGAAVSAAFVCTQNLERVPDDEQTGKNPNAKDLPRIRSGYKIAVHIKGGAADRKKGSCLHRARFGKYVRE